MFPRYKKSLFDIFTKSYAKADHLFVVQKSDRIFFVWHLDY
jgi:hypothetical protein